MGIPKTASAATVVVSQEYRLWANCSVHLVSGPVFFFLIFLVMFVFLQSLE